LTNTARRGIFGSSDFLLLDANRGGWEKSPVATDWAKVFESGFAAPVSVVQRRVWRAAFGSEYPEGVDPFSFVSRTELVRFSAELMVEGMGHLVDVGCGRGGPGLWVAAHTGARLTGVDIAASALAAAGERARSLGLAARAEFMRGSFESMPLDSGSVDAVMSVDALLFAPDKQAAVAELGRVLRHGGRLVFTSWDYHSQPANRPPQVADHRPLLVAAGFLVQDYDETQGWFERHARVDAGLLAAAEELAAESGEDVGAVRTNIEEMHANLATMLRRVFVVARKMQ
jgi:SAM-dependent methyltransferase